MRLSKSFQLALNLLVHSKIRSWLTIIGIIVGIGAVVSIISISLGAQAQLESRIGSLGADVLTISPGGGRAGGFGFGGGGPGEGGGRGGGSVITSTSKNLTEKDIIAIKSVPNVKYVMGQVSGTADVSFSSKTAINQRISGVDISTWKDVTTEKLASGRFLLPGDADSVVIGDRTANTQFGTPISLNNKIMIAGKTFNVVGILTDGGSIYMPIDVARTTLTGVGEKEFSSISVKITDVSLGNQTVNDLTSKLMLERGILDSKKQDFSVSNPAAMQATIASTLSTMTLFLGAIAAISLLVGAIGIANTMFTSVLEKTKEIGIMKAIGTQNKDILSIFLLNSGLIGFVGGLGGVIIGVMSSALINTLAGTSGTTVTAAGRGGGGIFGALGSSSVISIPLIIAALLFAMVIGMIAGAIPAYRASKLNPVDALRYE